MRLTKAFWKSTSWLPSMSTVLRVRGRTNYIHSQHTLLLHNRDCLNPVTEAEVQKEQMGLGVGGDMEVGWGCLWGWWGQ